jgi:hypothetical protein
MPTSSIARPSKNLPKIWIFGLKIYHLATLGLAKSKNLSCIAMDEQA